MHVYARNEAKQNQNNVLCRAVRLIEETLRYSRILKKCSRIIKNIDVNMEIYQNIDFDKF